MIRLKIKKKLMINDDYVKSWKLKSDTLMGQFAAVHHL